MFGLSSRSAQRKDPTWTQSPPVAGKGASTQAAYKPSQTQAAAPRKPSAGRAWLLAALGVVGLLAVAALVAGMFRVVEDQVARNKPHSVVNASGR